MKWEKVKLGNVTDSCLGKMLDQNKNKGDYQPYLANVNVRWGEFDLEDLPLMKFEESEQERYELKYGDLVICEGGEPGRCAIWKEQIPNMKIQKALHRVRVHDCLDYRYLFYWFLLAGKTGELDQYFTGATIKHMPGQKLKEVVIDKPPLEIQHRIADILSAYDDLIENNQKQIKLLEEAAQRLYKEWFVDLRFPGHENTKIVDGVPEGWNWCKLEDAIQLDPKVTLTKERMKQFIPMSALSTSSMVLDESQFTETTSNSGSKFQNGDTLLARITPCLENGKTAYVSGLKSDEGAVGSTEYIVMRAKTINSYMVYLLARTDDFRQSAINSMSGSDGRQRVKSDKLKMLDYLHPTSELVEKFENVEEPIFEKIYRLSKQMQQAKQARDLLLPKLMSGGVNLWRTST